MTVATRVFTIHVCPDCGHYDADPILRRPHSIRCFPCGQRAERALDLSRTHSAWVHSKKHQARESAPLMVPTRVTALDETRSGGTQ